MKAGLRQEDRPAPVPIWVLSFGDMITNLLACFVMLQSLATRRDETLFNAGLGSYRRVVAQFGLPDWLVGKTHKSSFASRKIKYPMESADEKKEPPRDVDAEDEQVREAFSQLQKAIQTRSCDERRNVLGVRQTEIRFSGPAAELDEAGRREVSGLAAELRQALGDKPACIYVIGFARDQPAGKAQWLESTRRAAAVEAFLRARLPAELLKRSWTIYAWGAGPGGGERAFGAVPGQAHVVLAITEAGAEYGR